MERPQANIERPIDEFDHELTQVQADAIALADELLKRKRENSPLTFVDIVLVDDQHEMLAEIEAGPLSHLLAKPGKQLAMKFDRHPRLDVRKKNGEFTGMSLRVWGWDEDKFRYTKPHSDGPPYEFKEYPGEKDKTRQLEISMGYEVGEETVTESLSVYTSSSRHDYIYASSQVYMDAYMEQGYEGHGGKSDYDISSEAVEWFLEFIARHVGDQPKSFHDLDEERIARIREIADAHGAREGIDELIAATWNTQAIYIMRRPCLLLGGKSILECLGSAETAVQAGEAAREVAKRWKKGEWGSCFVTSEESGE